MLHRIDLVLRADDGYGTVIRAGNSDVCAASERGTAGADLRYADGAGGGGSGAFGGSAHVRGIQRVFVFLWGGAFHRRTASGFAPGKTREDRRKALAAGTGGVLQRRGDAGDAAHSSDVFLPVSGIFFSAEFGSDSPYDSGDGGRAFLYADGRFFPRDCIRGRLC